MPQKRVWTNASLFEDGTQCTFGHVARVVGNGRVAVGLAVKPDFVRASGLAVKLEPQPF